MGKSPWTTLAVALAFVLGGCASSPFSAFFTSTSPAAASLPAVKPEETFPPRPLTLLYTTFQDHAVLQRDKPIHVWGLTGPGAQVSVTLAGETASATADSKGNWQTVLAPLAAGGPYELTATSSSGQTQTNKDVLIGDVYLCSGQSNMEMPLRVASNYDADIRNAQNTKIRLFHVQRFSSPLPSRTFGADASWSVASPESVKEFSAACYLFGRELQSAANVPIGLIESSWGGANIQAWISADTLRALGGFDEQLDILSIYATAPKTAEAKWRAFAHAWWLKHDPASTASPPWSDPAYDDSSWEQIVQTGSWREWNVPLMKKFDGTVWLRKGFELSAKQAAGVAVLSLGAADQADTTWVNGVEVGDMGGYDVDRLYDISAGTLHEGKNLLAVGVLGGAGLLNPAEQITLKCADGSVIRLSGTWRFRTSAPMSQTGHIPYVPWLKQFGLSVLYNGEIVPLGPTSVRGILWYQGESDAWQPQEYGRLLQALIEDWRKQFGADVPFIVVQLPGYGPPSTKPEESMWAELRETQRRVVDETPNTGLAVTIDLGQTDNIHPTNKQEVGRRLALVAEHLIYGMNVADSGPTPMAAVRKGNTIAVSFAHLEKGLAIYESKRPIGFQVCDKTKVCSFVDAMQNKDEIDLDVTHIRDTATVRYCWADSPICNVYNSEALPAVPFEIPITEATRLRK
ncbi:MAG: sialate O-acetylesterase [Rhizomicrobium sp.]